MTYECLDWAGDRHKVSIEGDVILSSQEHHIYISMSCLPPTRPSFSVYYKLQCKQYGSLEEAIAEFANCFLHANAPLCVEEPT